MQRLASILTVVYLPALALVVAGFCPPAQAQADTPTQQADTPTQQADTPTQPTNTSTDSLWTREQLTSDWWGLRTDLHDHGIDFGLRLAQYGQWVTSGGVNTNGEYGGLMDYRINFDGNKFFGLWEGGSVNLHASTRFGQDVNADAGAFSLGNTGLLYPLPGDYHGTNIVALMFSQSLYGGRVDAFFGKVSAIDLVNGFFPQIGFGQEGFWNVSALVTALPWFRYVNLSMWGGGFFTIKNQKVQSGFLFIGTENVSTTWNFKESFEDGVELYSWWRSFWDFSDMPGYFLVFGGGSTKKYDSNDPHDWVNVPGVGLVSIERKRAWNIAAYFYQVFWQAENAPNRKATLFIGGTGGPSNPQFSNWNIFAQLETFGPMASRPQDRMGVSGWFNGLSDNFVDRTSSVGIFLRDTWGVEIYYSFEINPWLHLSPDLQFIMNENQGDDVAIIPGIRLVVDL